ncbi:Matrix metalloproteinase-14 [Holothuria leucospilota]|uniref:Matrix metalloproteinase-14 n=1 Tax=Holothuria leucospilota TaxID=206669 RepID=A0A9Q1CHF9_HOLLE|nr:Matrix metalloproteinase-14 [Holothuria leucospilota]
MFPILKRDTCLFFILLLQMHLKSAQAREECVSGVYDAITRTSDGNTYAFQGSMVSKLTPSGNYVAPGYPKPICSVFVGLPSHLDAALHWENTGKTYFFKGCQYYRFSGTTLDSGYPKSISANWQGVPCDIDAAVVWSGNGRTYFFKGSVYYRYNRDTNRVDSGYPSSFGTNRWSGLPSPINAAFQWKNGKTYFFRGEQYYRYNDGQDRVDSGYPLITTEEWLGCEKSSPLSEATKDMCYFV